MPRKTLENIKFTTPTLGAEIEILPYETTETSQLNEVVYLAYASLDMRAAADIKKEAEAAGREATDEDGQKAVTFEKLPATAITEIKNNAIRGYVVKIDGSDFGGDADAILEEIKKFPRTDYDFIQGEIDKLKEDSTLNPKDEQKSPSSTPAPSPAK